MCGDSLPLFVDELVSTFNFNTFAVGSIVALKAGAADQNTAFSALFTFGFAAVIANGVRQNTDFNPIRSVYRLFEQDNVLECCVFRPLGQLAGAFLSGWLLFFLFDNESNFGLNTKPQGLADVNAFIFEAFVSFTICYFLADPDNKNARGNFIVYGIAGLLTYNYTQGSGNLAKSVSSVFFNWLRKDKDIADVTESDYSDLLFLAGAGFAGAAACGVFKKFIERFLPTADQDGEERDSNRHIAMDNQ